MLFAVITATFIISHLIPSDPASVAAGPQADPAQIKATAHALGLDQPVPVQYWTYLRGLIHGDFGTSYQSRQPVTGELLQALPATLELIFWSFLLYLVIGLCAGVVWAARPGRPIAVVIRIATGLFIAMPVFWVAIVLQLWISGRAGWLPINGRLDRDVLPPMHITGFYTFDALATLDFPALLDAVRHLALPVLTLVIWMFAVAARLTQKSMTVELSKEYVRVAVAKGVGPVRILLGHVFRNAIGPVMSVLGLQLGWLLGGTVMVEVVFSWPGIGTYLYSALQAFDFPAITAVTIVVTVGFVLANLVVDLAYPLVDPRVRTG